MIGESLAADASEAGSEAAQRSERMLRDAREQLQAAQMDADTRAAQLEQATAAAARAHAEAVAAKEEGGAAHADARAARAQLAVVEEQSERDIAAADRRAGEAEAQRRLTEERVEAQAAQLSALNEELASTRAELTAAHSAARASAAAEIAEVNAEAEEMRARLRAAEERLAASSERVSRGEARLAEEMAAREAAEEAAQLAKRGGGGGGLERMEALLEGGGSGTDATTMALRAEVRSQRARMAQLEGENRTLQLRVSSGGVGAAGMKAGGGFRGLVGGEKGRGIWRPRVWLVCYLVLLHVWLMYHIRRSSHGVWSETSLFSAGDAHSLPGWEGHEAKLP